MLYVRPQGWHPDKPGEARASLPGHPPPPCRPTHPPACASCLSPLGGRPGCCVPPPKAGTDLSLLVIALSPLLFSRLRRSCNDTRLWGRFITVTPGPDSVYEELWPFCLPARSPSSCSPRLGSFPCALGLLLPTRLPAPAGARPGGGGGSGVLLLLWHFIRQRCCYPLF